ncbi:MAG: hypothetical protein U0Q15_00510 [Kineosporiaceae bacterium]
MGFGGLVAVGLVHVGLVDVGLVAVGLVDVGLVAVGLVAVGLVDVGLGGLREVGLREVGLREVGLRDLVALREVGLRDLVALLEVGGLPEVVVAVCDVMTPSEPTAGPEATTPSVKARPTMAAAAISGSRTERPDADDIVPPHTGHVFEDP